MPGKPVAQQSGHSQRGHAAAVLRTGETQIARVLRLVLAETKIVSGLVFVLDHCEDDPGELSELAAMLGQRSIPLFVFHECADHDERSLKAKPVFKRMADASGGVYAEFKPDIPARCFGKCSRMSGRSRRLVPRALTASRRRKTPEARALQGRLRLLLGPARREG